MGGALTNPVSARQARKQALQVVGRHQYIAVGQHNPCVARRAPTFGDVVELGVLRQAIVTDQQAGLNLWMFTNELLHQWHHEIISARAAKQHLVGPIVQLERGAQRQLLVGIHAAHRADDGDGWAVSESREPSST